MGSVTPTKRHSTEQTLVSPLVSQGRKHARCWLTLTLFFHHHQAIELGKDNVDMSKALSKRDEKRVVEHLKSLQAQVNGWETPWRC
jgi:hypothetical protein